MKQINSCPVLQSVLSLALLIACIVTISSAQTSSVVPTLVNISGTLADANGKPLTGTVGVTFHLYKDEQGGAPLWMETQNVQPDKSGHYTVALGSTSSQGLPTSLFASGEARWLGVQAHSPAQLRRSGDGQYPEAGLVFDQKGNLYGTTDRGGAHAYGTVFKLTAVGKETVLYSFCKTNCADGAYPVAGLIFNQKGNLYGTTAGGGAHGYGTAFKLTAAGKDTVLYSFCAQNNCTDGNQPSAVLVFDQKGNLYGTTYYGGLTTCTIGCGTVFKLSKHDVR
jgi:uncharacterized repeat protein (TIGR03803 family)